MMTTRNVRRRLSVTSVAAALVLTGCSGAEDAESTEAVADVTEAPTAEDTVTEDSTADATASETGADDEAAQETAAVLEDPAAFVGEQVTAVGTVDEVVSEYLFYVGMSQSAHQPLLVLHDGSLDLEEADEVTVSGEVRQSLEIGEAEAFVGEDVDDALVGTYSGDVYVQANSVEEAAA
jgi:hypothetical protein